MTDAGANETLRDEVRRLRIRVEICGVALDSLVTAQEPRATHVRGAHHARTRTSSTYQP